MLKFEFVPSIVTTIVQRSLIQEIGGFDEGISICADFDFMLRLATRSEICALPESLVLVREHAGRTSAQLRLADVHVDQERVFRKAAAEATSRRIRLICLRQCAVQLAEQAGAQSREGSHLAAFATLARAFSGGPFNRVLWIRAVACAARAMGWK
jgi:hypothetical protein